MNRKDAFEILHMKAYGLEEIFLSVSNDQVIREEDMEYATEACYQILEALSTLEVEDINEDED